MSDANKFDNFIKGELGNLSPDVSPDIWDKIVSEREKRRPGFFWWPPFNAKNVLIIAGVLATLATGTSLFVMNDINKVKENSETNTPISKIKNSVNLVSGKETFAPTTTTENKQDLTNKIQTNTVQFEKRKTENRLNIATANRSKDDNKFSESKVLAAIKEKEVPDNNMSIASESLPVQASSASDRFFFDKVDVLSVDRLSVSDILKKTIPKVYMPECPQIEKDAAANKKYLELYVGPDFIFRNFTDTSKSVYLQRRKESTKVMSAFSVGLRYSKVFKNGMGFKTGINYSQINERFTFTQNNLVQVTYIIDPQTGDTTSSYTVTGTRQKVTRNRYRFIDVPLLIGYELGNGRLHTNISVGTMVNIYSWQRGDVLDSTYQPVNITTGKTSSPYQFKTNIGVALTGSISLYYKLTNRIHLMAEPYFRYNLSPMSKDVLSFKQKYNTLGVHLGVRLDLE